MACGGDSKDSHGSGGSSTAGAGTGGSSGAAGATKGGTSGAGTTSGGSSGTSSAGKGGSGGGSGGSSGGSSGATSGTGQGGASSGASGVTSGGSSGAGDGGSKGGASGSGQEGGGAGASGGSAGGSGLDCPGQPPADGTPCTLDTNPSQPRADCSYGNDPRPSCRTLAVCFQSEWQVTPPEGGCSDPPLPSACPEFAPDTGDECSDTSLACWYGDGTNCECIPCEEGRKYPFCVTADPPAWACSEPQSTCPNPPPQAGAPCSEPGQQCGPNCEEPINCSDDGYWVYERERCPICASPATPIATPEGERAIAELRPGDLVYSVEDGAIVAVPLLSVGSTRVWSHHVMRVELDDGRVLEVSPGHPTGDGRHFSDLVPGGLLDEQHGVVRAELVPYRYERTYDILPASSTATYFAAGALIGTTLR